ncbi:tol-pal system protein YbgF [Pseudomonadota bacterium]
MFISRDLVLKKLVTPSKWMVTGLIAFPIWAQAQTVISAPKPTVRSQTVQIESAAPAVAPDGGPKSKGSDAMQVLTDLEGLREELAALRNEIEVQQNELTKLRSEHQLLSDGFSDKLTQQEAGLNKRLEEISPPEEKLTQQGEKLAQQEEKLTQQEEKLTQQEEKLTQQEEKLTQQEEKLTQQEEKLTQQGEKLTQQGEKLTQQEEKLTQQEEKLTQQGEKLTQQEEKLTQQEEKLTQQGEKLTQQETKLTQQGEKLTQQETKLAQQGELVSATQEQLSEFRTETTEKISGISDHQAGQKTQAQIARVGSIGGPGGEVSELQLTKSAPGQAGIGRPVTALTKSSSSMGRPGRSPTAAVPVTHPPSGISVTNATIASPILTPQTNQPTSSGTRPIAAGGGLGSTSLGQVAARDQGLASGRNSRMPGNVANDNSSPPPFARANIPISDPVAEQTLYENAFELLKQSRYNEAIRGFNNLLFTYPSSALADDAQYWIAEAHYVTRGFESALLGFRTVVARYPNSPRVPDAMLRIGYIQYEVGAYNQARQTLGELVTRYPSSRVAVSAQTRMKKMNQEGR